jgi:AraC family transcriptional regulator
MTARTVPGGTFAVFVHRGPISTFHETVGAVWQRWLPESGLKPTGQPDFELYDSRFKAEAEDSEFEMWIPVHAPK